MNVLVKAAIAVACLGLASACSENGGENDSSTSKHKVSTKVAGLPLVRTWEVNCSIGHIGDGMSFQIKDGEVPDVKWISYSDDGKANRFIESNEAMFSTMTDLRWISRADLEEKAAVATKDFDSRTSPCKSYQEKLDRDYIEANDSSGDGKDLVSGLMEDLYHRREGLIDDKARCTTDACRKEIDALLEACGEEEWCKDTHRVTIAAFKSEKGDDKIRITIDFRRELSNDLHNGIVHGGW